MTPPMDPSRLMNPQRLMELWHQANDVLYMHDLEGRFLAVNATANHTYGYAESELLGMSIRDLVDPAHLGTALANMRAKASGATDRSAPYELLTRAKDGRPVWVEVSTRIVLEDGKPVAVQGAARDITARKHAESVADLVHDASLALNEAPTLQAGVQDALGRLAKAAGWAYAEAWFPDAEGKTLELGPQWTNGPGLEKFSRLARQYRYASGDGLPGRVWRDGLTLWGLDLPGTDDEFPRRAAAQAAGLRTFAAVPVAHNGRFAAALVFLGTHPTGEDARWVKAAEKVAAQLGASVGRRLDIERVRTAGRMFAAQFEALDDALLMLDPGGTPRMANRRFLELCHAKLTGTDAAVPLLERLTDPNAFLAAVATLYEDRSAGRDAVRFADRVLHREVMPLRSRTGEGLGVLLRLKQE